MWLGRSFTPRQGNPAWERQLHDTSPGCPANRTQPCVTDVVAPPIMSHDLFYWNVADQPWLDFNTTANSPGNGKRSMRECRFHQPSEPTALLERLHNPGAGRIKQCDKARHDVLPLSLYLGSRSTRIIHGLGNAAKQML